MGSWGSAPPLLLDILPSDSASGLLKRMEGLDLCISFIGLLVLSRLSFSGDSESYLGTAAELCVCAQRTFQRVPPFNYARLLLTGEYWLVLTTPGVGTSWFDRRRDSSCLPLLGDRACRFLSAFRPVMTATRKRGPYQLHRPSGGKPLVVQM